VPPKKKIYLDIGGTNIKKIGPTGSKDNLSTQAINCMEELIEWAEITHNSQVYMGIAGYVNKGTICSNDIGFLNLKIPELLKKTKTKIDCTHILNDVEAASMSLYQKMQTGERNLIIGLGTGTSQSLIFKDGHKLFVSQGEYGFCNIYTSTHIENCSLVRDYLSSTSYSTNESEYINHLIHWMDNLSCIFLPKEIFLLRGITKSSGEQIRDHFIHRPHLPSKSSMNNILGTINLNLMPYDSVLNGLSNFSHHKKNFIKLGKDI
jgi:hypothetical protein